MLVGLKQLWTRQTRSQPTELLSTDAYNFSLRQLQGFAENSLFGGGKTSLAKLGYFPGT